MVLAPWLVDSNRRALDAGTTAFCCTTGLGLGAWVVDSRQRDLMNDVYAELLEPPQTTWDLILIDVDHSPDEPLAEANAFFYTEAGLECAKKHLTPGGLLGVWSYAASSPFATALRAVFPHGEFEPVTFVESATKLGAAERKKILGGTAAQLMRIG